MTSTLLPIFPAIYDVLFDFAQSDGFWATLETAFGTSYDVVKATQLRQQWQSRNFSQIPPIEVLSGEVLGTANGAYSSSTNKIYLSASFLNTASSASIINVILEEIGHYVDAQINPVDSAGDEGAIFAELVQGNSLDVATLDALRAENDQTTIIVNGESIQVEQANFTGTNGNDNITGTSASDNIYGLDGNDTLSGLGGNDNIYGGNGNDSLNGDAGDDVIYDVIYSDAGNDTINGGTGFDYYSANYSNRTTGLTMTYDPTTGNGTITIGSEVDTLISIESFIDNSYNGKFTGTAFDDVIVGTSANDQSSYGGIFGGDGNDTISGGAGDDKLFGEEGNDVLNGGSNNDALYGGNGNDSVNGDAGDDYFTKDAGNDTINGGSGSDRYGVDYRNASSGLTMTYDTATGSGTITVGTETDTFTSIESFGGFNGTEYNDVIFGGTAGDYFSGGLAGGSGNDTISGNAGDDKLFGEDGNDVLNGGAGNDQFYGGNGNDTLQGTDGGIGEQDYLEGGTGNDRFILADTTKTFYDDGLTATEGTSDYAQITDFSTTDDTIQLRGSSSDYLLTVSGSTTNLYINKPGTEPDELIAYITDQTALSLTSSYFSYVSSPTLPTITLAVSPASVTEDGTTNLVYTFTRSGVTTNPLTVNYSIGGTATNGTDYASIPTSVTFAAGSSTATVTVDPTADTTVEDDETVILTLASGTDYTIGTTTAVTGTITNDDSNVTPIEAFGNTKLVQDTTNKLYAQIGNNNPIAIKIWDTQITTNSYSGWQTIAAETVNGVNQILWKYNDSNHLHLWTLDSNWNWQSSQGGWTVNSPEAFSQETNFQQDFNGDGIIGQLYTTIEAFGNTKLVQDATNKLYTQIGNNNPITLKVLATQITTNTYPGWQILAAETVNGVNQVLLRNTPQNLLYIWNLDSNWNWQSSQGGWTLNSPEAFTQETNFQQDFNSDGIIGQPFTPIEAFGNTKLVQDATNNLYAQIGNNNPIAIKAGATQITTNTYPGWQTLAAETVNGINQVLWKNTPQNLLYIWNLDTNWNWQSSTGGWGLNSPEAFSQETNFQQDFNGDNQIGNPSPGILAVSANVPEPIIGSSNDDILTGTADNDILVGGLGNDTITGGAGGDKFTFNNRNEGIDTITDFLSSQGDKIALSAGGFGGGLAAGVAITSAQFVLGTTALNASNRFIYNTITGGLFFDGDGTGTLAAIQIATLSSKPTLTASDILVLV